MMYVGFHSVRPWLPTARLQRIVEGMVVDVDDDLQSGGIFESVDLSLFLLLVSLWTCFNWPYLVPCLKLLGSSSSPSSSSSVAPISAGTLSPFECGEGKRRSCQCGEEESILV